MSSTPYDHIPLRKFVKPFDAGQKKCWEMFQEMKHQKELIRYVDNIQLDWDRYTDWEVPPMVNTIATWGWKPTERTEIPNKVRYVNECNIHAPDSMDKTNPVILKQTGDESLSVDTYKWAKEFWGKHLGVTWMRCSRFCSPAMNIIPLHIDRFRQMAEIFDSREDPITCGDVKFGVIFLTDWELGQGFGFGDKILTGWKKGDAWTMPWFYPHYTFNCSEVERNSLTFFATSKEISKPIS